MLSRRRRTVGPDHVRIPIVAPRGAAIRQALASDPLSPLLHGFSVGLHAACRRSDEALADFRRAVELAQSPSLLAQARDQARSRVAHLDWQQIALQVEALMLQAAGASPSVDSVLRPAMVQRSAPLL